MIVLIEKGIPACLWSNQTEHNFPAQILTHILHIVLKALIISFNWWRVVPGRRQRNCSPLDTHSQFKIYDEIIDDLQLFVIGNQRNVVQWINYRRRKLDNELVSCAWSNIPLLTGSTAGRRSPYQAFANTIHLPMSLAKNVGTSNRLRRNSQLLIRCTHYVKDST